MGAEFVCWVLAWAVRVLPSHLSRPLCLWVHARRCGRGRHLMQRPRPTNVTARGQFVLTGRVRTCGLCGAQTMTAEDFSAAMRG